MKADPLAQRQLLDVQELDSRADQLRHQRTSMPELARIAALEASRRALDDQRRDVQIQVTDLTSAQRKAEFDAEQVRTRRTRDRDRMQTGQVANPKDLERMQQELTSLDRRIAVLEDEELEVMEQLEAAQTSHDDLVGQVALLDEQLVELAEARDRRLAVLDAELATTLERRGPAAEGLPADLVALYEKLRTSKGGVGAAALRARQCTGCSMALDNAEVGTYRNAPDDLVLRHEECQRILVRTEDSGL